jgi:hypothetical protein
MNHGGKRKGHMKTIKASELKAGDEPVFRGKKCLINDKTVQPLVVRVGPHKHPEKMLVYFSLSPARDDFETQKYGAPYKRDEQITIK